MGAHACAVHTPDLLATLGPLAPLNEPDEESVRPDELLRWVAVERDHDPVIAGHGWRVELDDEVWLLVDPDRDDVADALADHAGVQSVVPLDREVLAVSAPTLCADGVHAAVVTAVVSAHARARDVTDGEKVAPDDAAATRSASLSDPQTSPVKADDEDEARLVTGDARSAGRRLVQVWVDQDGILVLPSGTIPHGPLDPGDNPRFRRTTYDAAAAAALAAEHDGRWIPFEEVDLVGLRRPGTFRPRWSVTVHLRQGGAVSFTWRGTRAHALLLWAYAVAKCGLERVHGSP